VGDLVPVSFNLENDIDLEISEVEVTLSDNEPEIINLDGLTGHKVAKYLLGSSEFGLICEFMKKYEKGTIPAEFYLAPNEFIVSLLSTFVKFAAYAAEDGIKFDYLGLHLAEGISMLLSRLGIFSVIDIITDTYYVLFVPCDYAKKLSEMISYDKYEYTSSESIQVQNDTVLDSIVSIAILSSVEYPKVYDITVPSTKNFGLANGLQVYDTSEVGYIQRRLVKAMEDCKINHDLTVRNAGGAIIQFLYGEDGMNSVKLEKQKLFNIDMSSTDLMKEYLFVLEDIPETIFLPDVIKKIQDTAEDWEAKCFDLYTKILQERMKMITQVFKLKMENTVHYPISLWRLIETTKMLFHKQATLCDLHPQDVLDAIDTLQNDLYVSKSHRANDLFMVLVRSYLSPKQVILKHRFNKVSLDYIVKTIKYKFFESIAHPSEMVGVVAAQSIGEPTTQLSSHATTKIIITGDATYNGEVGAFIDKLLEENKDEVMNLGNDSVVYQPKKDYKIIGVSSTEKNSWNRILEVSRHRANGNLVRVTTRTGKVTTATLSHSFLKRSDNSIVPVKGSDLKVGDRVPCAMQIPEVKDPLHFIKIGPLDHELEHDFGHFIGAYLADGKICVPEEEIATCCRVHGGIPVHKDIANFMRQFGQGYRQKIPGWVFSANKEFIRGLIQGYFNGKCHCYSTSEQLVIDISLLLAYFGIFSLKRESIRGHVLIIEREYATSFRKQFLGHPAASRETNMDLPTYDMIPALGNIIAEIAGKIMGFHWFEEDTVGRQKLRQYIDIFSNINENVLLLRNCKKEKRIDKVWTRQEYEEMKDKIELLRQAAYSDVVWDEIISLELIQDDGSYVYDFTVPGNDSFMVDNGILVHNTLNTSN
jgi:intein/homing endonuclease